MFCSYWHKYDIHNIKKIQRRLRHTVCWPPVLTFTLTFRVAPRARPLVCAGAGHHVSPTRCHRRELHTSVETGDILVSNDTLQQPITWYASTKKAQQVFVRSSQSPDRCTYMLLFGYLPDSNLKRNKIRSFMWQWGNIATSPFWQSIVCVPFFFVTSGIDIIVKTNYQNWIFVLMG